MVLMPFLISPILAKGLPFPNGGAWLSLPSKPLVTAKKFRETAQEALIKRVAEFEVLNRAKRRVLRKQSTLPTLMKRAGSNWGCNRSDYGDLPVSNKIVESKILPRFLKGECSDKQFEIVMNAWLYDPAEFSRLYYDYGKFPNFISNNFGSSIDNFEEMANLIQKAVEETIDYNRKNLELRSQLVSAGVRKSDARNATRQLSLELPDLTSQAEELENLIGRGRARHFLHYMEYLLKNSKAFKRSDIMDLAQMCYAYDCDLFRCDKAMENTFRDFVPFRDKLVARFNELPSRIEEVLDK